MSGTIALSDELRWSADRWLFDWTVRFLATRVTSAELAAELRAVVEEQKACLAFEDYGPRAAAQLDGLIRDRLLRAADAELPRAMPGRTVALDHLRGLVSLVG
jgi:DNA-binding GntR family transcriptional regulator